jgi:hypothetical protein
MVHSPFYPVIVTVVAGLSVVVIAFALVMVASFPGETWQLLKKSLHVRRNIKAAWWLWQLKRNLRNSSTIHRRLKSDISRVRSDSVEDSVKWREKHGKPSSSE